MKDLHLTKWSNYMKGEVTSYNWRISRVQVKIDEGYFINSFVDHVCDESTSLLSGLDKIILIGSGNPIALYPKDAENLNEIKIYLESIKGTDINTILISVVEDADMFIDSELIDDMLIEIKSVAKMQIRFLLRD